MMMLLPMKIRIPLQVIPLYICSGMACIDLITHSESGDVARQYIDDQNGLYTLAHAERIGLGSCTYALLDIS